MYGKLTYVPASSGKTVEHLVSQRLTYVGRDKDCAIRVEDDSVDGKQFVISVIDKQVRIQNLSRKSPTLVNDISVGIREERELGNRDTISFCNRQFVWTMSASSGKRTPASCLKRPRKSEPVRKVAVVTPQRREVPVAEDWVMPPEKRRRTMFDPAGTPDTSAFARRVKYDRVLKEKMTPSRRKQSMNRGTPASGMKNHQTAFNKSITPGKFYRGNSAPFVFGGFNSAPEEPMSPGLLSGCYSFLSMGDSPKSRRSSRVSTPYPPSSYFSSTSGSPRMMRAESPTALSGGSGTPLQGRRSLAHSSRSSSYGTPQDPSVNHDSLYVNASTSSQMRFQDFGGSSINQSRCSWTSGARSPRSDSFAHTPPQMRTPRRSRGPIESPRSAAFSPNQPEANTSGYVLLSPRGRNIISRAFDRNDMSLQMSPQPSRRFFNFSPRASDNRRSVQPSAQPLSVQVLTKSLKKKLHFTANSPQNYMATPNKKEMRLDGGAPSISGGMPGNTPKSLRSTDPKRTALRQSSRKSEATTPSKLISPIDSGANTRSTKKIAPTARERKLTKSLSAESVVESHVTSVRNSLPSSFEKSKRIKVPVEGVVPATRSASRSLTPNNSKVETPGSMRRSRTFFVSPRISPRIQGAPGPSSVTERKSKNEAIQSPLSNTTSRRSLSSTPQQSSEPDLFRSSRKSGNTQTPLPESSKRPVRATLRQSSVPDFVSPSKSSFLGRKVLESSPVVSPRVEQAVQSGSRSINSEAVSPGKITLPNTSVEVNMRSSRKVSSKEKDSPSTPLYAWKRKLAKSLSAESVVVNHGSSVRNSLPAFFEKSNKSEPAAKQTKTPNKESKGDTACSKRRSRASIIGEAAHIFHTRDSPGSRKSPGLPTLVLPTINIIPSTPPSRLSSAPASGEPSLRPTVSYEPSCRSSRASNELSPRSLRSSRRPSVIALPHGIRKTSQRKKSSTYGDHDTSIRGRPSNGIDVDESSARTQKRASDRPVPVTPPRSVEPEVLMRSSRKNSHVRETVSPPTPTSVLRRNARRSVKKTSVRSVAKKLSLMSPRKGSEVKKLTLDPEKPDKNKMAALIACHKKKSPTKENRASTSFLDEKVSPRRTVPETLTPLKDLDAQPEERSPEDQLLDALDLSRKSSIVAEPKRPSRRLRSSTSLRLSASATASLNASTTASLPASPTKSVKKLLFKTPLVEYEGSQSQVERSPTSTIKGILSSTPTTSSEEPMNRVFTTSPVVDFTDASGRKKIFIASPNSKSKAGGIRELVPTDETDLNIWTLFEDPNSSPGSSGKKRKGTEVPHSSSGKKAKTPEKSEMVSPPQSTKRKQVVQEDSEVISRGKRTCKAAEKPSKKTPPVEAVKKTPRKAVIAKRVKSTPPSDKSTPPKTTNKKGSPQVLTKQLKKVFANVKSAYKATKIKSPSQSKSPKTPSPAETRRSAAAKTAKTAKKPKPMAGKATTGNVSKTVPSLAKPKKVAKPTKTKSGGAGARKSLTPAPSALLTRRGAVAKPQKAEKQPSKVLPKARGGKASQSSPVPSPAKTRRGAAAETTTKKVQAAKIEPKAAPSKVALPSPLKPSKKKKTPTPIKTAPKGRKPAASADSSSKAVVSKAKPQKPPAPSRSQVSPKKTMGKVAASKASPKKTRGKVATSKASPKPSPKKTRAKIAASKASPKPTSAKKATQGGKAKTQSDNTKASPRPTSAKKATQGGKSTTRSAKTKASPKPTSAKKATQGGKAKTQGAKTKASPKPTSAKKATQGGKAKTRGAKTKASPKLTSAKEATQRGKAATQGAETKAPRLSVLPKPLRGKAVGAKANMNRSPKKSPVKTRSCKAAAAPASKRER